MPRQQQSQHRPPGVQLARAGSRQASALSQHIQGADRAAFFNDVNNVTITGGIFNQVIQQGGHEVTGEDDEAQFQRIKWGDIHLGDMVSKATIVERRTTRTGRVKAVVVGEKTIYQAKIFPSAEPFTVVAYKGLDFGKYKQDAIEQQSIFSPYIPQLFGVTNSRFMNAVIYHDDLIPLWSIWSMCTTSISEKLLYHLMVNSRS
ncbi:hypothetical protein C8F01DRAFT_636485 [Mycena amicta]|nr:hypothetical protein C8F01DRAFT_636018 [Mycena amicta]KAJ7051932.1 hypothetical protein C8F01DRAFT_636485 [Mycena amicta]